MTIGDHAVMLDGIRVGTSEALSVPIGEQIRVEIRFRPYWPGLFHLMAVLADEEPGE